MRLRTTQQGKPPIPLFFPQCRSSRSIAAALCFKSKKRAGNRRLLRHCVSKAKKELAIADCCGIVFLRVFRARLRVYTYNECFFKISLEKPM